MSKRLSATTKWDDPWYQELTPTHKCFWQFILDKCDHAGIWVVNWRAAEFNIGTKLDQNEILEIFEDRIVIICNNSKWFIPGFVNFQYGELNKNNRVHVSVINVLSKYNLLDGAFKPLINPLQGVKDKDKAKDKVKVKEKVKDNCTKNELEFQKLTFQFSDKYSKEMLNDFIRYWTEKNKSGTKLRCELQPTFDIKRRLVTWSKNERFTKKTDIPNYDNLKREIFDDMAASDGNENPQ